ncbi:MAG: alpha amylase C-terminal domain-containing protein [Desulfobacterales bacterium]|nr:alpha amylase C-terminal domain-containing protein [Desulfobacterales bacterium]
MVSADNHTDLIQHRIDRRLARDSFLEPYQADIKRRIEKILQAKQRLTGGEISLADFAAGHEYFGLHFRDNQWIFREWAPNAEAVYIIGDMTEWKEEAGYCLKHTGRDGIWEIRLSPDALHHGNYYRLRIYWPGGSGDRIPAYARRVVQDPETLIFNAQVWAPETPYQWQNSALSRDFNDLLIYEAHIGMAQSYEGIGSYTEFKDNVLPRIVDAGYNAIQLMAIQEHPYYGSFGYQVSNFFAASSRYGTPDELKALVDAAHEAGLLVLMDIVHSHAVTNEVEGLSRFDGTDYQYFHSGDRGWHPAWDSRCFDYGKIQVLHFLLSNCRFWLDEYRFDGFRFDGVTSMLYLDHGLEKAFTSYADYFTNNVDEEALVYLALANEVIHSVNPHAVTVAEDMSGMPGLGVALKDGGYGFDCRFAMGVPDFWIKLTKDTPDEEWPMGYLWHELNNRRADERTISYAESHDQALVGDQTLIFRLIGADMYEHMHVDDTQMGVDRGMALHKMIRLITLATAGSGYLNFMGNEFGHPEWIDFPRAGNGWSYRYARRQWHLADDPSLKYHQLGQFDRAMVWMAKETGLLDTPAAERLHEHNENKILAFKRNGLLFAFNFHPASSYTDYQIDCPPGSFRMILNTDDPQFGGHNRLTPGQVHHAFPPDSGPPANRQVISLYLPARTAIVLQPV